MNSSAGEHRPLLPTARRPADRATTATRLTRWLLAAIVAICASVSFAQSQAAPVSLHGHVLPALAQATPSSNASLSTAVTPGGEPLTITVVLRRSDPQGFARYLTDVYDPQSPQFRKFLTPAQVTERFGPSKAEYEAVTRYFQPYGFAVSEGSANRMTVTLRGTRAVAERALAVTFGEYTIGERTFYAIDRNPSLPANVAALVEAVTGLSNLATPTAKPQPVLDALPDTPWARALWYALCANKAVNGGYSADTGFAVAFFQILLGEEILILSLINSLYSIAQASDLSSSGTGQQYAKCVDKYNERHGYGQIGLTDPPPPAWQGADGTGQTIGLVEFDTFVMSDVADYIALMGQTSGPLGNLSQVHVNGGATLGANQDEVLLDIDDVLTTAPGAHIVVYDAPFTGSGTSFQAIFNAMINDGVTIISNSWAYCEDQTTLADVQSIDTILQTAAASGISVFSGTGDRGSTCLDGSPNTAHVPATSPFITAVGGTSLQLYPGFTYGKETWWNDAGTIPPGGQGGFGVSRFFARPSYQNGVTSSVMRSIPDVASNADPHYGVKICRASGGGCPMGGWWGGTSSSTPTWAGFAALLNQTQGSNLGFFNPQIYPLANTDAFHNAASMGSDFAHVGLGSPNLARLHQHLTGQTVGPVSPSVSSVRAYAQTTATLPPGATVALPSYADGTTQTFIVVTLSDANGNPVGGKSITLSAAPAGSAVFTPPNNSSAAVTAADSGVAHFWVTNTTIETITITATDTTDGIVLDEKPRVAFVAQPAASASISAGPSNVLNDGFAATTITVTLHDAQNNPSPGKEIRLSQGSGHSVISGPTPSVTNALGSIQFTATNHYAEAVTFTAVDVTDDNLVVPGSAAVTFSGTANASCVAQPPPTAAAGFTLTPFVTGFATSVLSFGGVDWGCRGGSNPAFASDGSVYAANFPDGSVFKFPAQGGAAGSSTKLGTLGPALYGPVIGIDGRIYIARGATTGNFSTGAIYELDPVTGATVRTVASPVTCPTALAVDPLSGDLFFGDSCFGNGSDNPNLYRVANPASATPTVSVYTTLPHTPMGWIAFAPDGTIFVPQDPTLATGSPVLRISGTDVPGPPTQTLVPGLLTFYWVNVAEVLPSGAAKSLIVLDPPSLHMKLADITTNPPTYTDLIAGGTSSGVIGPDGCLYVTTVDTIMKLAPAAGGCGFATTSPAPSLTLSPATASPNPAQGTTQSITATFGNVDVPAGTPVTFTIEGVNSQLKLATTVGTSAVATITYVGTLAGTDTVTATGTAGSTKLASNTATVTWTAGHHQSVVGLNVSPSGSVACAPATLTATLTDTSMNPLAAIAGATIHFTLGAQSCDGLTNASGVASCSVKPTGSGPLPMTASYAGNSLHASATVSQQFTVATPAGGGPVPNCVYSRKMHGIAGTFDLPLSTVSTNPTIEPRQGPTHTIVFAFDSPVTAAGTAVVMEGAATAGTPAVNGNEVVVGLNGITDRQYVTVSLTGVVSANTAVGGGTVRIGFLLGDVNQNRVVTVADMVLINAQLGFAVTPANFLKDVNANGVMSVGDLVVTNTVLGRSLGPP